VVSAREPARAPDDGSASSGQPAASASWRAAGPAPSPATTTVGTGPRERRRRAAAGSTTAGIAAVSAGSGAPAAADHPPTGSTTLRPAVDGVGQPSSSGDGTRGSRKARSRCTGPGVPVRAPVAAATALAASARRSRSSSGRPVGAGTSAASRTAEPNIPGCSVVWLAPVPRSSCGRSAVSSSSGTPAWCASRTAGCRFATAVPDVVTTATGRAIAGRPSPGPVGTSLQGEALAIPRARNAASRSSTRTCSRSAGACCGRSSSGRAAAASAKASGALREPGASTTSRTPSAASAWTSTRAAAVDGLVDGVVTAAIMPEEPGPLLPRGRPAPATGRRGRAPPRRPSAGPARATAGARRSPRRAAAAVP